MTQSASIRLASDIIGDHRELDRSRWDCSILDHHTADLKVVNEYGRVELRHYVLIPSINRLARLLAITY